MRCFAFVLAVLSGACFVELNGGYSPSVHYTEAPLDGVSAGADHTSTGFTIGVNVGVYLDLYGAAAYWAWYHGDALRDVAGQPKDLTPNGQSVRFDVDLPYRPHPLLVLRGTYGYDWISKVTSGGGGGDDHVATASGSSWFAGLTIAPYLKDLSLALGVEHMQWEAEQDGNFTPARSGSGWFGQARLMIRFVPESSGFAHGYSPSVEAQTPSWCSNPGTHNEGRWGVSGYYTEEVSNC